MESSEQSRKLPIMSNPVKKIKERSITPGKSFGINPGNGMFNMPFDEAMVNVRLFAESKDVDRFTLALKGAANVFPRYPRERIQLLSIEIRDLVRNMFAQSSNNPAQAAIWLWSLSKIGLTSRVAANFNLYMNLLEVVVTSNAATSRDVVTAITGMIRVDFKEIKFSPTLQTRLLQAIERVSSSMNAREVGNLLYGLGKLKFQWSSLTQKSQENILQKFCIHKKELMAGEGSMSIYAMGLLGASVANMSEDFKKNLFDVVYGIMLENMSSQAYSNCLYGLAKMQVKFEDLPPLIVKMISEGLADRSSKFIEQEFTNVIYS